MYENQAGGYDSSLHTGIMRANELGLLDRRRYAPPLTAALPAPPAGREDFAEDADGPNTERGQMNRKTAGDVPDRRRGVLDTGCA